MTPGQINAAKTAHGGNFDLLQQIVCDGGNMLNVKDYNLTWDDINEILTMEVKTDNVIEAKDVFTIYTSYEHIFYLWFAPSIAIRDGMLQSNNEFFNG